MARKGKPISLAARELHKVMDVMAFRFAEKMINNVIVAAPRDTGDFKRSWDPQRPQSIQDYTKPYKFSSALPYSATITFDTAYPSSWGGQNRLKSASADWFFVVMKSLGDDLRDAIRDGENEL
jgi:hypothetical protein